MGLPQGPSQYTHTAACRPSLQAANFRADPIQLQDKNSSSKNYVYLEKNAVGIFMQTSHMVVQMGPRGEGLLAIFAGVCKASRKVNIFHVLPQVAPVLANFATDSAPVQLGSILHNVIVQLLVTCAGQRCYMQLL